MNIQIKDHVGLTESECLALAQSLIRNRAPKQGGFNYLGESHGAIGITLGVNLPYPIWVSQINNRKSDKSPIIIEIKKMS